MKVVYPNVIPLENVKVTRHSVLFYLAAFLIQPVKNWREEVGGYCPSTVKKKIHFMDLNFLALNS